MDNEMSKDVREMNKDVEVVNVDKWIADTRKHLKSMSKNDLIRTVMKLVLQLQAEKVKNEKADNAVVVTNDGGGADSEAQTA